MEKMKVWMAWFDVGGEGEYGREFFFMQEDAQRYLAENVATYEECGNYVDCHCVQVEVR